VDETNSPGNGTFESRTPTTNRADGSVTLQRLLSSDYDELLRRERTVLEELRVHLARLNASDEDQAVLKRSLQQIEELFLIVVVGEFNAGKTAFLNALLGQSLLPEGVTPTTSHIHVVRHLDGINVDPPNEDYRIIRAPVEWLRELNLVDTPGTNAVIQRHQEITETFIPRSDLVLFVTSVERPFTESERLFLERIREWGKKIVIVINKIDLAEEESEIQEVVEYVGRNAQELLRLSPEIFPASARLALRAKVAVQSDDELLENQQWKESRFGALEKYILTTLDAEERVRLKLESPLGVASLLIDQYRDLIANRKAVLRGDFETLDLIEEQLEAYQVDMRRDFKYQSSRVDNVLYEMAERGDRFFDETLRLTRVFELLNGEKIRADFERQVVGDTSQEIERHVGALIDWMVEKDYRMWNDVISFIDRRATEHSERMVGQVSSEFEFNRQAMLATVGRDAQRVVETYDREAESRKLAQDMQRAIMQTAAVEVGALGLGALLVAVLQTSMLDVTGILGASAIAAMGLYVLPYRRSKIKLELREKINDLRSQLDAALTRQFEKELGDSVQRIREAVAPYTRFVRVEREKLEMLESELALASTEVTQLRAMIDELSTTAAVDTRAEHPLP
jgi:small GTP-binding protein